MFSVTSRYHGIETAKWIGPNGQEIVHLRRRIVPDFSNAIVLAEHTATQDERLDNITARYLGDPEQFWRLCDVNNAKHPEELTAETGRRLRIPLMQEG